MNRLFTAISLFTIFMLAACSQPKDTKPVVTVTIEPQRYFAEAIAGDNFKINCMVPAGSNPESYDPTTQQMVDLGKSEAYFKIGHIGFEQAWMQNIIDNNKQLKIYDNSDNFPLIEGVEHTHEDGTTCSASHDHDHAGVDPHTWSSIQGARIISANMLKAFEELDPANASVYQANYNKLVATIDSTASVVDRLMQHPSSQTFIIYHPALTYFARDYGLTQLCIEINGKEPSPAQIKKLIEGARESGAKVVFIQQEFDKKNAEVISKETECELVQINPLAYDWNGEMINIAKALSNEQ